MTNNEMRTAKLIDKLTQPMPNGTSLGLLITGLFIIAMCLTVFIYEFIKPANPEVRSVPVRTEGR